MQPGQPTADDAVRMNKQWPVSLLRSVAYTQETPVSQGLWPWLLSKAVFCPAAVLGANETLFQEEEPADICCLQPQSLCGPTCRGLNAQLCGFGNEGLKLFVHTCLLQAACSCMCLGLPLVAWLAALQRQKVVAKHMVDDSHDDRWVSTALYPCSLLQMHTLLQQHRQPFNQSAAPYGAPAVQHMTACDSQAVSQAHSVPGPLTSAMSASRVLRAVHNHTARSDSRGLCRTAAGSRLDESISSETSSGVVDSPAVKIREDSQLLAPTQERSCNAALSVKQPGSQQHLEPCNSSNRLQDMPVLGGPLSARLRCNSSTGGVVSTTAGMQPGSSSNGGGADGADVHIEMAPLSARRREQQLQHQQHQGAGPRGPVTPRVTHSRPQLPPKHRSSTSSLQKTPAAEVNPITAADNRSASGPSDIAAGQQVVSPMVRCSTAGEVGETTAVVTRTSKELQASQHTAEAGPLALQTCNDTAAAQQPRPCAFDASCGDLSSSRVSVQGSYSKLQLSHEDIPLMAIKPTPGRLPRGLDCSRSGKASLASSWQHRCSGDKQLIPASSLPAEQSAVSSNSHSAEQPAAAAETLLGNQCNQQYATLQSDICNFASWLGGQGPSRTDLHVAHSTVQQTPHDEEHEEHVQQQQSQDPSVATSDAATDLDDQSFPMPHQQDSDLVVLGEASTLSPGSFETSREGATSPTAEETAAGQVDAGVSAIMQAGKGRFRMSDWAYMSDLCNLGGSFDVGGNTGLAAALSPLAEEGYDSAGTSREVPLEQQQEQVPAGPSDNAARGSVGVLNSSSGTSHQQQQQSIRPRAASGSWPDANPSPPSTLHATLDSQKTSTASFHGGAVEEAAAATAVIASAAGEGFTPVAVVDSEMAPAAAPSSAAEVTKGQPSAAISSSSAATKLDPAMLAAVTGTSDTNQLTASQEELAAKLAKLAFANAAATKKSSDRQQGKQPLSQQGGLLAGAAVRVLDEPFYPTMMSDMCNLAEPLSDREEPEQEGTDMSTQQLLAEAKAATAAQKYVLQSVHQQQPPYRKQFKPAGHVNQHRASIQRKSQLRAGRSSAAGPLRSALLRRQRPAAVPRPGAARQASAAGAAGTIAAESFAHRAGPAAPGTPGYTLESFDSYYPDCDLNPSVSDVPAAVKGGGDAAGGGKVTYVNPYYMYRDSTASSLVTGNTMGGSPPRSPKRAVKSGHVAAAVAVFECQSAAAAAAAEEDEVESDLHAEWQQDKSRPSSPALGVASPKGSWAVVDASLEARAH